MNTKPFLYHHSEGVIRQKPEMEKPECFRNDDSDFDCPDCEKYRIHIESRPTYPAPNFPAEWEGRELIEGWDFELFECDFCDGCGWYEGGKTIKTNCEHCKGAGVIAKISSPPSSPDKADSRGEEKQPFENFPKLAKVIEWFANNVEVPGTMWNDLLYQINLAIYQSEHDTKADDKPGFESYIQKARDEFSSLITKTFPAGSDTEIRNAAENILIAYDQIRDKLFAADEIEKLKAENLKLADELDEFKKKAEFTILILRGENRKLRNDKLTIQKEAGLDPYWYWPQCDVEGCEQVSCSGGMGWRETGYWSLCPDHLEMHRNGEPQPKMKDSSIEKEKTRDENGLLP